MDPHFLERFPLWVNRWSRVPRLESFVPWFHAVISAQPRQTRCKRAPDVEEGIRPWLDERHHTNGDRPEKIKTAEGLVEYAAPQVRDTPEPFVSAIRAALGGRTAALEQLAVGWLTVGAQSNPKPRNRCCWAPNIKF